MKCCNELLALVKRLYELFGQGDNKSDDNYNSERDEGEQAEGAVNG